MSIQHIIPPLYEIDYNNNSLLFVLYLIGTNAGLE
jgi:hypothetical protein